MGWYIAHFLDEQTVSMVSEKWPKKNLKKCYFPKVQAASKIKKETPVDKKSGEWGLHPCRILMHGKKYSTFKEAKKAEKTGQNYSTMTSFEKSYDANQEARKHPNVYNDSSDTDCEDAKKVEELKELDGSVLSFNKEYTYHRNDSVNDAGSAIQTSEGEDVQSCVENEVSIDGSESEDVDDNVILEENSDPIESSDEENGEEIGEIAENSEEEESVDMNENFYEENGNATETSERGDDDVPGYDVSDKNIFSYRDNNLESTSELRSPPKDYDFSDDRRIVRVEKLLIHACQELESIKHEMKALKIKSSETEQVVDKLVLVCKDLSVEVFACTEEFKKRNGMFTDLLVPDLKLTVKRRKDFKKNELALANNKVTDNMNKYLASTVNENKEKRFIAGCFNAIFDIEFLTNKVWWKSEPGKVVMKKSRILNCMKESFKLKFGLVVPQKNDKEIVSLIHKTCRNMKDSYRKGLKKAREANEKAEKDAEEEVKKAAKKASKKTKKENAKKAEKETVKKAEKETACETAKNTACETTNAALLAEMDWNVEDYENYKKHKKAKKAAKKAKMISDQSDRDDPAVGKPEVKRAKKRLAKDDIENDAKKRKKTV